MHICYIDWGGNHRGYIQEYDGQGFVMGSISAPTHKYAESGNRVIYTDITISTTCFLQSCIKFEQSCGQINIPVSLLSTGVFSSTLFEWREHWPS